LASAAARGLERDLREQERGLVLVRIELLREQLAP